MEEEIKQNEEEEEDPFQIIFTTIANAIEKKPELLEKGLGRILNLVELGMIKSPAEKEKRQYSMAIAVLVITGLVIFVATIANLEGTLDSGAFSFLLGMVIGLLFAFLGKFLSFR